jgi:hypothetical protein
MTVLLIVQWRLITFLRRCHERFMVGHFTSIYFGEGMKKMLGLVFFGRAIKASLRGQEGLKIVNAMGEWLAVM